MSGADELEPDGQPQASRDGETGGPWPSQTDCVTPENGRETGVSSHPEADRDLLPIDRVEEFRREYPELASLPLTEKHGRSLRREVTEADHEPQYVEPVREWESGHVTYRLRERRAATWADALFAFLDAHQRYEEGMSVRFRGHDDGEEIEFEVGLNDSWGEVYANQEYARAQALERQLAGGEHPDGTEIEGEWDNLVTVMLTFTGSSVPGGERLPPVDQFDPVSDSWSYGAVRDTVRNICETELGLESHEWGYLRFAEPHGVGAAASDDDPGLNACYSHTHVGVYLDIDAPSEYIQRAFHKAIDKHLDVCDIAGFNAHNYKHENEQRRPISVNTDVANMGSYMASYLCTFSSKEVEEGERPEYVPLIERPIEYVAWASVMWSMNRQRIGRSRVINEAIKADKCAADYRADSVDQDHDHGERLQHRSGYGSEIVCAECGSGWRIDQEAETISETRLAEPDPSESEHAPASYSGTHGSCSSHDLDHELEESTTQCWETDDPLGLAGSLISSDGVTSVRWGETPSEAAVRSTVEAYIETHGTDHSIPTLLGELGIDPTKSHIVEEVLNGENSAATVETERLRDTEPDSEWELVAFIDENGEEHRPSSSGGVEMVETHLPVTNLLAETRLKHVGDRGNPKIRCRRCRTATYSPRSAAGHLVHDHDIEQPDYADHLLRFESFGRDLPSCFDPPSDPADV